MYSTCLFCHGPLGANEVVETFPVGRRLAFDQARGRLWVVCRKCERWNLTPFEERWDAIEYCERRFRDARKRVSTDNIGLARLDESLELVRIGEPMRPEFAAWRYGDQFGRRLRRNILIGVPIGVVGIGLAGSSLFTGVVGSASFIALQVSHWAAQWHTWRRVATWVPLPSGVRVPLRLTHLLKARLEVASERDDGFRLVIPFIAGETTLTGHHARHAASLIMPKLNSVGGNKGLVQKAVSKLETAGHPQEFLRRVTMAANSPPFKPAAKPFRLTVDRSPGLIGYMSWADKLALEIAVNEENERHALEGELALLELEWKDAEEIAGIADRLAIPESVEEQLDDLKARTPRA